MKKESTQIKNDTLTRCNTLIFYVLLLFAGLVSFSNTLYAEGTREILVNTTTYVVGGTTFQQFDTTKTIYTGTAITTPANMFQIWDNGPSAGGVGRISGTYSSILPANSLYRTKIRVKVGDVINIGFNPFQDETSYWRLYNANNLSVRFNNAAISTNLNALGIETAGVDINGNPCFSYLVPKSTTAGQPGYIRYYSQTAVGPNPACSTVVAGGNAVHNAGELGRLYPARTYCGYNSIKYIVQASDIPAGQTCADFFIVMNRNNANNVQNVKGMYTMFDVTVWEPTGAPINLAAITPADFVVRKARMFSAAWDVNCNGTSSPRQTFNSRLYFYSKDSVVSSVTFNQMRPHGFVISANATGTSNTGAAAFDRKSRIQFHGAPEYPIFLNNPFPTAVANQTCGITPKSSFGNLIDATITGCDNDRCINLLVDKTGTVGITLIPKNPADFTPRVFNNSTVVANVNTCIPWDGLDGAGNPIIGPFTVQVNYFNGLTNLPLFDVEFHEFGYIIDLIAPAPSFGAKPILVYWDDRADPSTGPVDLNAGTSRDGLWDNDNNPLTADIVVGYHDNDPVNAFQAHSTYNSLGCDPTVDHSLLTAGRQGCHLWFDKGRNITCPTSGGINCAETMNTWWNANVIERDVTYNPSNVKVFSDPGLVPVLGVPGPSSSRIKNFCSTVNPIPIQGVIKIDNTITAAPLAAAILDANSVEDDINGTGTWTLVPGNASGSLGSAANNLTNTYIPVNADYVRGFVKLVITSDLTALAPCGTANDTLRINLFRGPDVWTRTNVTTCAANSITSLDPGLVGDSSGVNAITTSFIWEPFFGGVPLVGGIFVPNNQSLGSLATYTPPASFTTGVITMRLTSVNTTVPAVATCPADFSEFTITVNNGPTVDAGTTLTACNSGVGTQVTIPANHATTNAAPGSTFQWTGNGSFAGASNTISAPVVYNPTAAELALGTAKLLLRVTQTTPACQPTVDTLVISFTLPPTVDAGPDLSRCKNNLSTITLNGSAMGASSVSWSSAPATGTFSAVSNAVSDFTPTGALANSYALTLTANSAVCPSVTDQAILTLTDSATITMLTPTISYCPENPTIQLNATITPGFTGQWFANEAGTISPLGTFTPSATDPNAQYTLDDSETPILLFGLVYVTSTVGNSCSKQSERVGITPAEVPTISVSDMSVCANAPTVSLSATVGTGGFANYTWSSLGTTQAFVPVTSVFLPANTVFTPSAADRNNGSVKVVFSLQPAVASCSPVTDTMTITFTPAPTANAGSDLNVCNNNPTVDIVGSVTPIGTATPSWSVVAGAPGNFSSPGSLATSFTATGTPAVGATTTIRLTSALAGCQSVTNDAIITYTGPPVVSVTTAGGTLCKNNPVIVLKGTSTSGALHWSSSSNCATCFSDTNAVAPDSTIYTPSVTDLNNNSVSFTVNSRNNGNCAVVNSTNVTFNFVNSPTVNLQTYTPVCENNAVINLTETAASLTGATGGSWTSSSGCLTCFADPLALTTTYTPSVTDITNGTVLLTLTSTGNTSNCVAVQDTTRINITRAPSIIAGPDLTVCSNQNTIALSGASSTNTSSIAWSVQTGSGSITNAASIGGAIYNISAQDKIDGTAIVLLTGNGNGSCAPVSQQRVILFTDIPTANAGPDKTVCMNDATPALLDGSGSAGGTWTCAGCAGAITNATLLSGSYTPAAGDINQTRTFTYSVPASGGCPAVSDAVNIHFNPAPTISTGGPYTMCGNAAVINLTGSSVTGATNVIWTTDGTGSFGAQTSLVSTYTPSASDTSGTGIVNLTLTTTDAGPCSDVSANTTLTITKPTVISAGPNQNQCGSVGATVSLIGTLSGAATFNTWSIVGPFSGTLNNPTSLAGATYTVAAGDIGNSVIFRATSNSTAACAAQLDDVTHTFTAAPTVAIQPATSTDVCQNGSITLDGLITGTNTGTWSCTNCAGTGTFSPNNTYNELIPQRSVQFTAAPADTNKASLTFVLTTDNVNVCGSVPSTTVTVNLEKQPKVAAGPDIILCANNNVHTLAGSMTNSTTGVWRSGAAKTTGFFDGSNNPTNLFSSITPATAAFTYDPDTADVQNGFATLTLFSTGTSFCPSDSDKVTITFSQSPVANAGLDRTVCKNSPTLNLVGTINPAAGFNPTWTSEFCSTPCFSSPTALMTNYTANTADTTGHTSMLLFLTATDPTGLCSPDVDTLVLNLTEPPVVSITSNFPDPICTDSLFIQLSGTVSSGGFNWSSTGTGNFQANAFVNPVFYPFTAADRAKANLPFPNNFIRIYLSSDAGFCAPVKDSVDVTLTPQPTVVITTGPIDSTEICANQNTIDLSATVDAGFNIDWTTSGNGTFSPDAPLPANNTTYTFTNLDRAAGTIILVAHSVNPAGNSCGAVSSQYKVKINPLTSVNAGANATVCQTVTEIDLSDAVSLNGTTRSEWTTTGTGVFGVTNATVGAGSVYYPSYLLTPPQINDVDLPSVTLRLTAYGCDTSFSERIITFTPKPDALAGADITVCNEANTVALNGTATNALNVRWKVSGSAVNFATTAAATYNITAADKTAGFVDLVFTVNGNGSCSPDRDTMRVIIRPQPSIAIGPDASFCSQTTSEILAYNFPAITMTNGIAPTWTSTGLAANIDAFNPLQPSYTIDAADIAAGSVTIVASTRSAIGCMAVTDAMVINISKAPTLDLGPTIEMCALSSNTVSPNATFTNGSGFPSWSSDKTGFFDDPNADPSIDPIVYNFDVVGLENTVGNTTTLYAFIAGNGSCPAVTDSVKINFTANPTLADLVDTTLCFTTGIPTVFNISSGINGDWISTDVTGTFSPAAGVNQQNVVFTTLTTASFTITFTPTDVCYLGQTADAIVTMIETPTVTASPNSDVCINNFGAPIALNAVQTNASTFQWSTIQGFGTLGSATSIPASYTLNADSTDFGLDSLMFRIVATSTSPTCFAEDTLVIITHRAPIVSSSNQTVCSDILNDANAISLNGTISNGFSNIAWINPVNIAVTTPTSINSTATVTGFPATLTLSATGLHASCAAVTANITIDQQLAPTFAVAGTDIQGCSNGAIIDLDQALLQPMINGVPSTVGGQWSTLGSGTFSPNAIGSSGITYNPSAADTATTLIDPIADVNLIYTITDTGVCYKGYADTINVVFNKPITIASTTPVRTFCAQDNAVGLNSTTNPSPFAAGPTITWTVESGIGVISPTGLFSATYDPDPIDVDNGGAILMVKIDGIVGCPADSDFVSLILVPEPAAIVNAGSTIQTCKDNDFVNLQGLIINADGGIWRTAKYPSPSNDFDFSDTTDLETKYFLTSADTAQSSIFLYLYSTGGNALCSQVVDSVEIVFTPLPLPIATVSVDNVCADVDFINLTGSFTVGGINGIWATSGDGVFSDIGIFDPTPVYVPGPTDIASGKVVFTYSSHNFQDCNSYFAKDTTTINPKILTDIGPNAVVCGNNMVGIPINASLTPATSLSTWSINGVNGIDYDGTSSISGSGLQFTYIPGAIIDPTVGAVSIKFVATDPNPATPTSIPCKADSSQMVLTIAPAPTVSIATNQQTVCNDVTSIPVNVTDIEVASAGTWTSTGTGNFTDPTALNTDYNFSASDLQAASITISFVTTGNVSNGSQCNAASDAMVITLKPKPIVDISTIANCFTATGIVLDNSSVTYVDPGASGVWTTSSAGVPTGQFSLDQFITGGSTAVSYFPSLTDISTGNVTLTLSSAGAGTCQPVSRSINLNVSTTPIADAGQDLFVCNAADVSLKATPFATLVQYDWQDISTPGLVVTGMEVTEGPISGTVDYVLTVTDVKGCTNTDTLTVNTVIDPQLTQAIESCYDFYGFVKITGQTSPVSPLGGYQWYFNDAIMSGETKDSVRITQPGTYHVVYSLGSCEINSLDTTLILDLPRILTPNFIGCENSTVSAQVTEIPNAQLAGYASGSLQPYAYTWTPGPVNGNPATLPTSPTSIDTLTYHVTATYTSDFTTCSYLDSVDVISIPVPDPALIDSTQVCEGSSVTLDANIAPSNLPSLAAFNPVMNWYVASDATKASLGTSSTLAVNTTNNYVIEVTIGQCIGDDTSTVSLRAFPTKTLPTDTTTCFDQIRENPTLGSPAGTIILHAGSSATSTPGLTNTTYSWFTNDPDPAINPNNTESAIITADMIRNQDDEQIVAMVNITNQYGTLSCATTDTIVVIDRCVPRVFPPNAFHPGGGSSGEQEIDQFFTVKGKYFTNYKITVYSRWGEVIFYTEDINQHWDGTYRGVLMPVGVYAYIITYEGKDENTKGPFKQEGRIVLVR